MIAKLLIHPTLETRLEAINNALNEAELKKDHPDVLWMNDEKLGVEQAKKIRQHLSLKPYSAKGRAVVVENAHLLTDEAQNSLLKTLEEPPTDAIILLGAESEKKILSTVLSRVEPVILSQATGNRLLTTETQTVAHKQWVVDIKKLSQMPIEQRFEYIEKLEDKEVFLQQLLEYSHQQLITYNSLPTTDFAKDLMQAEQWAENNGNIRAILEYLMLKMPW